MNHDAASNRIAEIDKEMSWHREQMDRWHVPMRQWITEHDDLRKQRQELTKGLLGKVKNAKAIKELDAKILHAKSEMVTFDAKAQEHADKRMELLREQNKLKGIG